MLDILEAVSSCQLLLYRDLLSPSLPILHSISLSNHLSANLSIQLLFSRPTEIFYTGYAHNFLSSIHSSTETSSKAFGIKDSASFSSTSSSFGRKKVASPSSTGHTGMSCKMQREREEEEKITCFRLRLATFSSLNSSQVTHLKTKNQVEDSDVQLFRQLPSAFYTVEVQEDTSQSKVRRQGRRIKVEKEEEVKIVIEKG